MSRVPWSPQPLEQLQARYAAALKPVYNQADFLRENAPDAPSGKPQHVFDFEDGYRIIVSKDRTPNDRLVIHISASMQGPVLDEDTLTHYAEMIRHWQLLAQTDQRPQSAGVSFGGIPHWYVELTH